jgi:hypothetical protein
VHLSHTVCSVLVPLPSLWADVSQQGESEAQFAREQSVIFPVKKLSVLLPACAAGNDRTHEHTHRRVVLVSLPSCMLVRPKADPGRVLFT